MEFPHSMGLLYTAVTQYLGFPSYGDEFKVMGLAPYGEPEYLDRLRRWSRVGPGQGSSWISPTSCTTGRCQHDVGQRRADYRRGVLAAARRSLGPRRPPCEPLEPVTEMSRRPSRRCSKRWSWACFARWRQRSGEKNLCLAGGVALNCTMNGKILAETPFEHVYIQPAAYDGGTSLGAALTSNIRLLGAPRDFVMDHPYWGLEYSPEACRRRSTPMDWRTVRLPDDCLADEAAATRSRMVASWVVSRDASNGAPAHWATGASSAIRATPAMKDHLNHRIKHRESFRPFAPSVLEEHAADWFEEPGPSPFMLMTCQVRREKQALVPAITHVDGTARQQTVSRATNPRYWALVQAFGGRPASLWS